MMAAFLNFKIYAGASSSAVCFFCGELGDRKDIRRASTLSVNKYLNDAARRIGDMELLGKLSKGDMVAADAVYDLYCLSSVYRKADAVDHASSETYSDKVIKA